jgi:hypothetical protein
MPSRQLSHVLFVETPRIPRQVFTEEKGSEEVMPHALVVFYLPPLSNVPSVK